jgi:hypothetical protein
MRPEPEMTQTEKRPEGIADQSERQSTNSIEDGVRNNCWTIAFLPTTLGTFIYDEFQLRS